MSFTIFTDSSANIPSALAQEYGIGVVPLSYTMDGTTQDSPDTREFDCAAFYRALDNGSRVTTSQINPQKYADYMKSALEAGNDILFVGMSSGISGSFASARIAEQMLQEQFPDRNIRLVDSLGASLGEGLQVLRGVRCREKGMSLDETADYLERVRANMYQVFTVNDLMYLRKGGRLSNAAALIGTLLNIKPILKGNEQGKIVSFEKTRGRKAVIAHLAKKYEQMALEPENQVVGISHCGCPEDAEALAALLRRSCPPKQIMIVEHEPVTGSYLGPGALALYFEGADDIRLK